MSGNKMFLHIGNGVSVKKQDIVAIIDIDNAGTSQQTKEYIKKMQKENKVRTVSTELPKSLIVTFDKKTELCHASPISVQTLNARINEGKVLRNWKKI